MIACLGACMVGLHESTTERGARTHACRVRTLCEHKPPHGDMIDTDMRLLSLSILSLAFAPIACSQPYKVTLHHGVAVPMRDGVTLIADIYQPEADGKFPVLLQRTPYNRAGSAGSAAAMAAHGYVVIIQDTRGRFDSHGEFYPFRYESQDGYDTIEWAAKLPYANGKVGMFGGSYVGATQMLAAIAAPPHLAGIQPYVTASEYYDGWTYQNGALMQWFA